MRPRHLRTPHLLAQIHICGSSRRMTGWLLRGAPPVLPSASEQMVLYLRSSARRAAIVLVVGILAGPAAPSAQNEKSTQSDKSISVVFDGWRKLPDGQSELLF